MRARNVYSAGYALVSRLRRAGASEAELAALSRLERGEAGLIDLERLRPLAAAAGLPWGELYPEIERAEVLG